MLILTGGGGDLSCSSPTSCHATLPEAWGGFTLGTNTLTFDLAESLVGESVGEREKTGDMLEDFTTHRNTSMRCKMGK